MKRSKLMRASVLLLVLTLITSCFVGGTFAKYVTEKEADDTARVAKWGVEIEFNDTNAFSNAYDKDSASYEWVDQVDTDDDGRLNIVSVWDSTSADNLIAPGTTQTYEGITVSGKPEVAVKVKTEATVTLGNENDWMVPSNINAPESDKFFYCPLVFTIGDEIICGLHYSGSEGSSYGGKDTFIRKIEEAIEKQAAGNNADIIDEEHIGVYAPQTDLSTQDISTAFTWAWAYDEEDKRGLHDDCDTDDTSALCYHVTDQDDQLDTYLGNLAANPGEENVPTIKIELATTVTQID